MKTDGDGKRYPLVYSPVKREKHAYVSPRVDRDTIVDFDAHDFKRSPIHFLILDEGTRGYRDVSYGTK